jgi:hypothetical protein
MLAEVLHAAVLRTMEIDGLTRFYLDRSVRQIMKSSVPYS